MDIYRWGAQRYVKVLVQEFEGNELIEPNQHYSKCLILYNTTPSEVMAEFRKHLESNGMKKIESVAPEKPKQIRIRKKHYTMTPEGSASKIAKMKAYWERRRLEKRD